jgi:hypothetical protein
MHVPLIIAKESEDDSESNHTIEEEQQSRNLAGPNAYMKKIFGKLAPIIGGTPAEEEGSKSMSNSKTSIDSPSPTANAKRMFQKNRYKARNSPLRQNLKRTISTIHNQFSRIKNFAENKPIISLRQFNPEGMQNTNKIKFK